MDSIDRIVADVSAQTTEIDSLKAFIASLKTQIADALAGTTLPPAVEARLAAIFPPLEANTQAIHDAMQENTPAAPPADPAPASPPADTPPASTDTPPTSTDGGSSQTPPAS